MDYSLRSGVKLINSIKSEKTKVFCESILAGMTESKSYNQIFSDKEMNQLSLMLAMDGPSLLLTIDAIMYIYRQCAFIRIAKKMAPFLHEIEVDDAHV